MSFWRIPSERISKEDLFKSCIIKDVPERGRPVTIVTADIIYINTKIINSMKGEIKVINLVLYIKDNKIANKL
jgi:GTP:adenosylcobinamide-phosphate guanylyltransferase